MVKDYKGVIVEESLEDNRSINDMEIISVRISDDEMPVNRWHLYTVKVSLQDIGNLSHRIKAGWYMHFWRGNDVIAVFRDKTFMFAHDDRATWEPVVRYGIAQGIPSKQLDFPIS
jgi:hypothetical protein